MEHSWIIVLAVAAGPFLIGGATWLAVSLSHRLADRRTVLQSFGPAVVVDEPCLGRPLLNGFGLAMALVVLIGSMSVFAGVVLGFGALGVMALIAIHGAVEPPIVVDPIAFDEEWRSFLDDAA